MTDQIGPLYRKLAAICLLGAMIWTAWSFVLSPALTVLSDRSDRIEDMQFQLNRLEAIGARGDSALPKLAAQIRSIASRGQTLNEASESLANANLQSRLNRLVRAKGATLRSIRSVPTTNPEDGLVRLAVAMEVTGELDSIQAVVHAVESSVPYLFVEKLTLSPSRRSGQATTLELEADFELSAYYLNRER